MKVLTKDYILSLVMEQMTGLSEMPNVEADAWTTEKLDEPMSIDLSGYASLNPDTNEVEQDKAIGTQLRIGPKGHKLLFFQNRNKDKQRTWVDINSKRVFTFLPRNDEYGTKYSGPKAIVKDPIPQGDDWHSKSKRDELERLKQEKIEGRLQEWSKRNLVFPVVNNLFQNSAIMKQLDKCGIPEIIGQNEYTEPVTNVKKVMNFNGPNISFNIHAVRDDEDVQKAIDKILDYRMSLETGEKMKGERPKPGKMVRNYAGQIYAGGKWSPEQRAHAEKHHELTPIYKLHKQAVQGGHKAFNVLSDLNIVGTLHGGEYTMVAMFLATKQIRTATISRGQNKGQLIKPIRVDVTMPVPEGIDFDNLTVAKISNDETASATANQREFFKQIMFELMGKLGKEIMNLDPDEVFEAMMFEPDDVDTDFIDNDNV
jgi:hypothetical protein